MQFKLKNQNVNKIDNEQKKYINEFTNLINDESYNKIVNCNICDGKNFLEISKKDRWNLDIYTKLCRDCGYLFTNPLLNDEVIKIFYQSYFRQIYKKFTTPSKEFYESEKHRGIEIINYVTKNNLYNKKSKSLDVGCGSGATSFIFSKFFESSVGCDENKQYTSNVEKSDNLKILNTNIQDEKENITRFLVMQKDIFQPEFKNNKYITSLLFKLKSKAGALYSALGSFTLNGVNLNKLQSFPEKNSFSSYFFLCELDGHIEEEKVKNSLEELGLHCEDMHVLGVFEADKFRYK